MSLADVLLEGALLNVADEFLVVQELLRRVDQFLLRGRAVSEVVRDAGEPHHAFGELGVGHRVGERVAQRLQRPRRNAGRPDDVLGCVSARAGDGEPFRQLASVAGAIAVGVGRRLRRDGRRGRARRQVGSVPPHATRTAESESLSAPMALSFAARGGEMAKASRRICASSGRAQLYPLRVGVVNSKRIGGALLEVRGVAEVGEFVPVDVAGFDARAYPVVGADVGDGGACRAACGASEEIGVAERARRVALVQPRLPAVEVGAGDVVRGTWRVLAALAAVAPSARMARHCSGNFSRTAAVWLSFGRLLLTGR